MKKRKNIFCRLELFSNSKTRNLTFKEWEEILEEYYPIRVDLDSSDRQILYREIRMENELAVRSNSWWLINIVSGLWCAFNLFLVIICLLHSQESFDSYWCEFYRLNVILSGLVSIIIYFLNNLKLFTIQDGEFAPGVLIENDYLLYPICYVTFLKNLENPEDKLNLSKSYIFEPGETFNLCRYSLAFICTIFLFAFWGNWFIISPLAVLIGYLVLGDVSVTITNRGVRSAFIFLDYFFPYELIKRISNTTKGVRILLYREHENSKVHIITCYDDNDKLYDCLNFFYLNYKND